MFQIVCGHNQKTESRSMASNAEGEDDKQIGSSMFDISLTSMCTCCPLMCFSNVG